MDQRFTRITGSQQNYSTEASEMQFAPGQWPAEFVDSTGAIWTKEGWDGREQAMVYVSDVYTLYIFND